MSDCKSKVNLFINACVRKNSRTKRLADLLLSRLGDYEEICLNEIPIHPLNPYELEKRTRLIAKGSYDDPMFDYAKQFAAADRIVIAAPYWDLSFPAVLKVYLENIYVTGIVSRYGADGRPVGLCNAKDLYFVTTAGGQYDPKYSYDCISALAKNCFGIGETHLIKAEMLDVDGFDVEEIMHRAEELIRMNKYI